MKIEDKRPAEFGGTASPDLAVTIILGAGVVFVLGVTIGVEINIVATVSYFIQEIHRLVN